MDDTPGDEAATELYIALVHHPVRSRHGGIETSSVTNIDVHDLARSCRTYGARALYVVTPVDAMRALVRRIMRHWDSGLGRDYNPSRTDALSIVRLERELAGVDIDIERRTGRLPKRVATTARHTDGAVGYETFRQTLEGDDGPYLLMLGTAWGLADELMDSADTVLEPLAGPSDYNHLSVRAAGAIILDRLRGTR